MFVLSSIIVYFHGVAPLQLKSGTSCIVVYLRSFLTFACARNIVFLFDGSKFLNVSIA